MRHSTPCGVQAHACMLTPLPEARIGSVLPRIVPEIGSVVLKEGGQLVRRVAPRAVSKSVRRLPLSSRQQVRRRKSKGIISHRGCAYQVTSTGGFPWGRPR